MPGIEFFVALAIYITIFLIITLSYNMVYGYLGVPDYGRALAAAGGGFLCGYLPGRLMAYVLVIQGDYLENVLLIVGDINTVLKTNALLSVALLLVTLILGAFVGSVLGLVASLPILRGVRMFYLAISLLVIQTGFQTICYHWEPILRGEFGVPVPDPFIWVTRYTPPGFSHGNMRGIAIIVACSMVLLITGYYFFSIGKSPLGRLLKAVRDDEKSAEALGRDVNRIVLKVMAVSYAFTGAAGVLFTYYSGYVSGSYFSNTLWTFWPLAMVILGGLANNWGTLIGTIVFIVLRHLITFYKAYLKPWLPFSPVWLDGLLLGVFLIFLLIYRPRGLVPEKAELPFSREKIEEIRRSRKTE